MGVEPAVLTLSLDSMSSNDTATLPMRVPKERYRSACVISEASKTFNGLTGFIFPSRNNCIVRFKSLFVQSVDHFVGGVCKSPPLPNLTF